MKKLLGVLLSMVMLFSLCGCSSQEAVYTVEKAGKTFEVDTVSGTIFDGTYKYQYTFFGDAEQYSVDITYPDGSTYFWEQTGNVGNGGWSDDYDAALYVEAETLREVIMESAPAASGTSASWKIVVAILLLAIGGLNVAAPRTAWQWEYGWRYKNAEPSDMALRVNRIGGVAALVIGVVMLII